MSVLRLEEACTVPGGARGDCWEALKPRRGALGRRDPPYAASETNERTNERTNEFLFGKWGLVWAPKLLCGSPQPLCIHPYHLWRG